MSLKIPPVIVTLVSILMMWGTTNLDIRIDARFHVSIWVSVTCTIIGLVIGITGVLQFIAHKTTVNPHRPKNSSSLVSGGIYKYTRNPMYLALLILLISIGFYLGSFLAFLILPLFILYMNKYQIIPEERVLDEIFGDDYKKYQERVRRWI
jgi:protein-S-isoprenylcysteine O-methyltransferase Ste14